MQRVTANLNRIATLLKSGLAHPQVLKEFRESVDRVREAGWIAQRIDSPSLLLSDGSLPHRKCYPT
jgi:hypothetical protein